MGYVRRPEEGRAERFRTIVRVLRTVFVLNVLVAGAKLAYGMTSGSVAMVADGYHSLFDGLSNVVGLVGVGLARRPADSGHPYGHGKYETWASLAIGVMLGLAAWNVGREALTRLLDGTAPPRVDAGSFAVMGGTLVVNVCVAVFERRVGRRLSSEVLIADSAHTASDVLVSLGVIGGLVAVRMGYPLVDPGLALVIALIIARAGWKVFRRAGETLSDSARIPIAALCDVVSRVGGVLGCHEVRTRGSLSEVYVDLHVQVDPDSSLREGHHIAERVERAVCDGFAQVADVIVHVEPMDQYQADKTARQMDDG